MRTSDIVHANWTPTALLALPFQYLFRTPLVLTYRGSDLRLLPKWLNRFIVRNVAATLDIWGDTKWANEQRALFPGNYRKLPIITRTPNPDTCKQASSNSDTTHFAFIGRLDSGYTGLRKGSTIILPAAQMAREKSKDFELDIVGDGPYKEDMESLRHEMNLDSIVHMHGFQLDVFPYILNSSAVIAASGLGAVIQESCLCKKAVIIPDFPENNANIWTHGINALIYTPGDADSLAEAILYVLEHPEEAEKIANAGHATILKYVARPEEGGKAYLDSFSKIITEFHNN